MRIRPRPLMLAALCAACACPAAHAADEDIVTARPDFVESSDTGGKGRVRKIDNASHKQSQGISSVGQAMQQLDRMTQQNAALVEEGAAAAESLQHQAETLAKAVAQFKLR